MLPALAADRLKFLIDYLSTVGCMDDVVLPDSSSVSGNLKCSEFENDFTFCFPSFSIHFVLAFHR